MVVINNTWVVNHLPTGLHPPQDTPTAAATGRKTLLSPRAGLPWEPQKVVVKACEAKAMEPGLVMTAT